MRKILSALLAIILLMGFTPMASVQAQAGTAAPPCSIEVIKLRADSVGSPYYSMDDAAAADANQTIYYAIKLELPSIADANAYYGNSGFLSGPNVEVTIKWSNIAGKGNQTVTVPFTSEKQTLWFDGSNFTAAWTPATVTDCGCGENHIRSAQLEDATQKAEIQTSVGTKDGNLSNITIGGCYSVEEKEYYGVTPCVNCKPVNLRGFLFSGSCSDYDVFFSTDAADHVTGAYVVDKDFRYYSGIVNAYEDTLYGWRIVGTYTANCLTGSCETRPGFDRVALPYHARLDVDNNLVNTEDVNLDWMLNGVSVPDGMTKAAYLDTLFAQWATELMKNFTVADLYTTYTKQDAIFTPATKAYTTATYTEFFAKSTYTGLTASTKTDVYIANSATDGNVTSDPLPDSTNTLHGWQIIGVVDVGCDTGTCRQIPKFDRVALPDYARLDAGNNLVNTEDANLDWMLNGVSVPDGTTKAAYLDTLFTQWTAEFVKNFTVDDLYTTYTKQDTTFSPATDGNVTSDPLPDSTNTLSAYQYITARYVYGDTYRLEEATLGSRLFQQVSATTVDCESNEEPYLNALNQLYSVLGFTYADIAAGNVIMSVRSLLAQYGSFSVFEQHRDTKTWAYYVGPGDIKINPPQAQIKLGGKQKFTATASGEGNLKLDVVWKVEGSQSRETKVSEDGELVVAADEQADTLILKAVDKNNPSRSGTVIVDVVSYNIKGQVKKGSAGKEAVDVVLKQGDNVMAETKTDSNGNYAFDRLAEGIYNVVASEGDGEDEVIRTSLADIHDNDLTMDVIELPMLLTNSVVTVTGGSTPNVVVGGLDDIFEDSASGSEAYTASDAQVASSGGSVKLTMQVEQEAKNENNENQKKIKEKKKDKEEITLYLDMSVSKEVKDSGGTVINSDGVPDTGRLLTIVIPLPEDMHGKPSYVVYRVHDGIAEQLGHSTGDKEGFEIIASEDMATPIMKIYAQKFSVYALGYSDEAPATPPVVIDRPTPAAGGTGSTGSTGSTGAAPVINGSMQDTELTVPYGQSATMTVSANNAGAYQWQVDRNDGRGWVDIDGANSASYMVTPAGTDLSGIKYRCKVSNGNGSVYSRVFTLHIVTAVADVPATGPGAACMLPCVLLLSAALLYICARGSLSHGRGDFKR